MLILEGLEIQLASGFLRDVRIILESEKERLSSKESVTTSLRGISSLERRVYDFNPDIFLIARKLDIDFEKKIEKLYNLV
jgi:hypothetical protein